MELKEYELKQAEIDNQTLQIVTRAVTELKEIRGEMSNLYIRVFDPIDFPENTSIDDMLYQTKDIIEKETHLGDCFITYNEELDKLIAVGYVSNQ